MLHFHNINFWMQEFNRKRLRVISIWYDDISFFCNKDKRRTYIITYIFISTFQVEKA